MKRIFFVFGVLLIWAGDVFSQQVPLYSLYHHNQFVYNPARTGFNGNAEVYVMYRKQWLDFEGAPETRAISFDIPVRNAGLGAYAFNDITSIFNRWGGYLSYAYHLKFKNDMHKLSLGIAAGVQDYRIDVAKINAKHVDDPLLTGGIERGTSFDGSAGLHYFVSDNALSKPKTEQPEVPEVTVTDDSTAAPRKSRSGNHSILNFSLGLSALSVYATDLKFLNDNDGGTYYRPARHYVGTLSNKFKLIDGKFILEPMVMAKLTESLNWQMDAGLLLGYKDWVWVSGTYRFDYGVTIGGGFKVHDAVKLGYSYDLSLNEIKDYTNGSHELMLGLTFGRKKDKDKEAEEEMKRINEKLQQQDSVLNNMQMQQDSMMNIMDSLSGQLDSLNEVLASGVWVEEEGSLDDMAQKYSEEDMEKIEDMSELSESEWKEKYGSEDYDKYKSLADKNAELTKKTQRLENKVQELESQIADLQKQMKSAASRQQQSSSQPKSTGGSTGTGDISEDRTRVVSEEDLEFKKGTRIGDYFMVVGSFRIEENSYKFEESLVKKGYEAGVVYDKKRKWYYVYIAQPTDLKKGVQDLYKLREENPEFHDAWIHIMSKSLR